MHTNCIRFGHLWVLHSLMDSTRYDELRKIQKWPPKNILQTAETRQNVSIYMRSAKNNTRPGVHDGYKPRTYFLDPPAQQTNVTVNH